MDKKELIKYVSYFTMGDGGLYYISRNTYPLYQTNKHIKNKEYTLWQQSILENITSCSYKEVDYTDIGGFKKTGLTCVLRTKSHPFFEPIQNRLYLDGRRVIDPHYLKLLDWEALAILYQDDGSVGIDKRPGRTPVAYLHMNRYSYGDLELVRRELHTRLGLEWNIQSDSKGHYRLQLRTKFYDTFVKNVNPFIFESFKYKIPEIPYDQPLESKGDEIV